MADLVQAWLDCRRSKRQSASAQAFEAHAERNLCALRDQLLAGTYRPGRSICFVVTHPKPREVWAADFGDRVVHHLLYNAIAPRFIAAFDVGSAACIPGRGTLYAARRLEHDVRSITQNWSRPAWYLKCDLANFFVAIDKRILQAQLHAKVTDPFWRWLTDTVLMHDPRTDYELRGDRRLLDRVPPHKRLVNAPADTGLPIGNLSSQFFANVHLDALDKHCRHQLHARYYGRYVDDFYLLHESPRWLNAALASITAFTTERLGAHLNPSKTILQPVERGIDFVGQVIRPWRRITRRRTLTVALRRIEEMPTSDTFAAGNSYLGLVRQADHSHADQARIARALMKRGHAVAGDLGKIFRSKGATTP
jgi:RNA-directed DNA polymerase